MIKTVRQLCIGDVITHLHGAPASASFADLFQSDESVTVTQLRADAGINAVKIVVFGQTGSAVPTAPPHSGHAPRWVSYLALRCDLGRVHRSGAGTLVTCEQHQHT
jgi:hypothetical protein